MRDRNSLKIGIGTPTILMIFVVLCMVILSVLSYQEADYHMKLAEKEKESITLYYEAVTRAKQVKDQLVNLSFEEIEEMYDVKVMEEEKVYHYTCRIDEHKELYVVIEKASLDTMTFRVRNRKEA